MYFPLKGLFHKDTSLFVVSYLIIFVIEMLILFLYLCDGFPDRHLQYQ